MTLLSFLSRPKRLLAVVALLLSVSTAVLADDPVMLNIHLADGTVQSVLLYTRPQVTFEDGRVVFTSSVATFSYDAQQVLRFTFSGSLPVWVSSPESQASYRRQGEQLFFDAKVKASAIQLFTEDGRRLPVNVQTSNGRISLSLQPLPAGVYVLSVNGQTSKIVKR